MCYAQYHEVVFSRLPEYGDDRASCGDSFCGESFPADFQSLGLDIQELLDIEFASGLTRLAGAAEVDVYKKDPRDHGDRTVTEINVPAVRIQPIMMSVSIRAEI